MHKNADLRANVTGAQCTENILLIVRVGDHVLIVKDLTGSCFNMPVGNDSQVFQTSHDFSGFHLNN